MPGSLLAFFCACVTGCRTVRASAAAALAQWQRRPSRHPAVHRACAAAAMHVLHIRQLAPISLRSSRSAGPDGPHTGCLHGSHAIARFYYCRGMSCARGVDSARPHDRPRTWVSAPAQRRLSVRMHPQTCRQFKDGSAYDAWGCDRRSRASDIVASSRLLLSR